MSKAYDLAVIGGGPGGYVAAIKASQLGLKVGLIEHRGSLGGTCLNVGCIPSKVLLRLSHAYEEGRDFNSRFCVGNDANSNKVDWSKCQSEKEKIVSGLTKGIEFLLKKNKVDHIKGFAAFENESSVRVNNDSIVNAKNFIVATGSAPSEMPGGKIKIDEKKILSSTGALALKSIPKKMVIIGAGVIGLELGSVFSRLGTKVEVVEFLDRIVPTMDADVAKTLQQVLEKEGVKFHLSRKVVDVKETHSGEMRVEFVDSKTSSNSEALGADVVLVAVGRRPFTEKLGVEKVNIERDKIGRIVVDQLLRTPNCPSVRAIGDVIHGPMLAHKAEDDGMFAAMSIAGVSDLEHLDYDTVPSVVYTHPEIASVGMSEEGLKAKGIKYRKVQFPMAANSRARAIDSSFGFIKLIVSEEGDKILGSAIVGAGAGDLIHQVSIAMRGKLSPADLSSVSFAHPTMSEAIKEAAMMAAVGKAIHC